MQATVLSSRSAGLVAMLVVVCLICGCQQAQRPGSLPSDLAVPIDHGFRQPDLSRLARAAFQNDVIYAGDVLKVSVATGLEEEPPSSWELRVADNGAITVPLIGEVPVAGLTTARADQAVAGASVERGIFIHPQVAVQLASRKSNRITVMGAVVEPGVKSLPAVGSDLLAALAAAGGLSEDSDTIVEIRHPTGNQFLNKSPIQPAAYQEAAVPGAANRSVVVDLAAAESSGNADLHLEDGSVVVVRKKPMRAVYVMGLVKQAGQYDIPPDRELRVLDALALAGGRTLQLANRVTIVRNDPRRSGPVVLQVSVKEAKKEKAANVVLAPGDVVSVEETPLTLGIETVKSFVRFGFSSAIPGF